MRHNQKEPIGFQHFFKDLVEGFIARTAVRPEAFTAHAAGDQFVVEQGDDFYLVVRPINLDLFGN